MEIRIRNLDATFVDKLNKKAKAKKLSREEFLREQLEIIAVIDLIEEHQKKVDKSTRAVTEMTIDCSNRLDITEKNFEKMVILGRNLK